MSALTTRLRYVSARNPDLITAFLTRLKHRVMIYSIVYKGDLWFCWYVPPDDMKKGVPDNVNLDG